jgi:hypothetical protein
MTKPTSLSSRTTAHRLQTWLALLDAGFGSAQGWSAWALGELMTLSPVPPWSVDLLYASSRSDAMSAAADGLHRLTEGRWPLDHTSLRLGILYLSHERGGLSLFLLLHLAGMVADRTSPDPEAFYGLLSDLEAGKPDVADRARALFARHAALARVQIDDLGLDDDALLRGHEDGP